MRWLWPALLLAALAGCETVGQDMQAPPGIPAGTSADLCGASGLQGLVGKPRSVLKTMEFGTETRIVGPDDAVTMDFRPERLSIVYGADRKIVTVACN